MKNQMSLLQAFQILNTPEPKTEQPTPKSKPKKPSNRSLLIGY